MSTPSQTTAAGARTANYVVARTARKNPDINGRTLYLTSIGLWTSDTDHAQRYTEKEALRLKGRDNELRVEKMPHALAKTGGAS